MGKGGTMTKQFTTPACVWQAPPMGWNSWDCYGASVTEAELLANARFLQEHLLPSGWDTVVCDIQWSEPAADSWDYHPFAPLTLDEYGRQLPAPGRFPSGFKAIAREIHGMGLQFGVHLMRGIPRQATHAGLPVLGTDYTAADVASRTSICFWNTDMYGVNPDHPAAQAYYDSVFALFAAWGVDYVKVDDIAWNYYAADHYCGGEVALIHRAILRSGRPMTLSLSPGPADPRQRAHLRHYANAWRITDDFWDSWPLVDRFLEACVAWVGDSGAGSWPDADMLPFGRLRMRARGAADGLPGEFSRLSDTEVQTVFRLWCLIRSPLMLGGDLPASPPELLELLTDKRFLEWSQAGSASVLLSEPAATLMAWTQRDALPGGRWPLLFINRSETSIDIDLSEWLLLFPPLAGWELLDADLHVEPHASAAFILSEK